MLAAFYYFDPSTVIYLIVVLMSPTPSIIFVFLLVFLRYFGFVLRPFVFLSLFELMPFDIFEFHLFAHVRESEAYCLFVPHALICRESFGMLRLSIVLAVLARCHCRCFLFRFSFFLTRRIAAAQIVTFLAALAALSTPFFVAMVSVGYPITLLL
jgi:hypothetical protein